MRVRFKWTVNTKLALIGVISLCNSKIIDILALLLQSMGIAIIRMRLYKRTYAAFPNE